MESRFVAFAVFAMLGSALAADQLTSGSTNSFNIVSHQQQQAYQQQPHYAQAQYQAQATAPQVHVVQPAIGLQYANLVQQAGSYQTQSVAQPLASASSTSGVQVQGQGKSHYNGAAGGAAAGATAAGKDQQSSGSGWGAASTTQHAAGSWGFNQEIVISVVSLLFIVPLLLFFFNFVLVKGPAPGHGGGGYGGGHGGHGGRPGITVYTKVPSFGGGGHGHGHRSSTQSVFASAASLMNQLDMDALTKVAIKAIETIF